MVTQSPCGTIIGIPWGPLALKFGPRASHDSGLPHDSLVSSILQGNQWVFPTTQTIELNEIRKSLPPLTVSGIASIDNIVWTLSSDLKFTISSLWDYMRSHYPTVSWSHVVWFPAHIPKCSLITWLAILNRLNMEDRLVLFGVKPASSCSLCNDSESHDHLFFRSPFTTQVWASVSTKLNVNWSAPTWSGWISLLSSFKGKSLRVTIIKLACLHGLPCIKFGLRGTKGNFKVLAALRMWYFKKSVRRLDSEFYLFPS